MFFPRNSQYQLVLIMIMFDCKHFCYQSDFHMYIDVSTQYAGKHKITLKSYYAVCSLHIRDLLYMYNVLKHILAYHEDQLLMPYLGS